MATNPVCYIQDDDWLVPSMQSLYYNYRRFPDHLHTVSNPFVYYLYWTWSYYDPNVEVHTRFNWIGLGAMVSKGEVGKFIEQASRYIHSDYLMYADMFFSTWR